MPECEFRECLFSWRNNFGTSLTIRHREDVEDEEDVALPKSSVENRISL